MIKSTFRLLAAIGKALAWVAIVCLVGFGQSAFEITLSEAPHNVYQVVELMDGNLVVSFRSDPPTYKHAIGLFSKSGRLLKWIVPLSSGATGPGNVKFLGGIAQHPSGLLWFADSDQNRFHHFTSTGEFSGSFLIQNPSVASHWLDFNTDGSYVFFGGCVPRERGAYQGCISLLHRRGTRGVSKTDGFLDSDRFPGWKQTELGHYRISEERLAVVGGRSGTVIAYTNLSAAKITFVNVESNAYVDVRLEAFTGAVPAIKTWQDAQNVFLGHPLIDGLVSLNDSVFVYIRNQMSDQSISLVEINLNGSIIRKWNRATLSGKLVGRSRQGHLVFALGNRIRFLQASQIGRVKF